MENVKYKKGYLCKIITELNWEEIRFLQRCKEKCEKLVVGLLSDELYLELGNQIPIRTFNELKEILLLLKCVDEVFLVNKEKLDIRKSYDEVEYDCVFIGSEYGAQYEKDFEFLRQRNVEIISVVPDSLSNVGEDRNLSRVLENAFVEGKIILFGTGNYFNYYMQLYGKKYPPAYAVDNDMDKWNTEKDKILIKSPEVLRGENPEDILVILCCKEHQEIKKQLLEIEKFDYRVLRRECTFSEIEEMYTLQYKKKKYKKGFLNLNFNELGIEQIEELKRCKDKCEKLIVGIPTDEFILRMTEKWPEHGFEEKREKILCSQVVDEIIEIDIDNLSIYDSYQKIQYDAYFYGQEYGKQYQCDREFLEEHNVAMISMLPEKLTSSDCEDAIWWAIRNIAYDREIILFGTGKYFDYYMEKYGKKFPPKYAVDNNKEKWNTKKLGVLIQSPEVLSKEEPKKVAVILCCKEYIEIRNQLLEIKNFNYRTLLYNHNLAIMEEFRVIRQEELDYIEKAHEILMKLMREFDRVCNELGLHYYVISGSLIGVVRHQGLIPWDDDIDVAMSHRDYKILKKKAKEIWNDEEFLFLDYDQIGKDAFYDFMTRVVYLKDEIPTGIFRKVRGKAREDIMNRMVLDIYVLEDTIPGIQHTVVTTMLKGVYALAMGHRGYIDYNDYNRLSEKEIKMLRIANKIGRIIPLKIIFLLYELLRGYAKNRKATYCFESNGVINYMPWIYEKELYGEGTRLPMHDVNVMVPADYHGLLKAKKYGNYMEYPGVIHRKPSHMAKTCGVIW